MGVDVRVHGGALVALWVIAVCAVVLVLIGWGLLVHVTAIRRAVAPGARDLAAVGTPSRAADPEG